MATHALHEILFIDIETVSQYADYEAVPDRIQQIWKKKSQIVAKDVEPDKSYFDKAAIYAEYGKVIVIGLGIVHGGFGDEKLRIKAFASDNELELLQKFSLFLEENKFIKKICAHNGKEFDFPYLCRRMLVNGIKIPQLLTVAHLKPWEIPHIDTLEMWKFGDWKNFTSLETLAAIFDIPTSKDNIDGSLVNKFYYEYQSLDKIEEYCKNDVLVLVQLYLRLMQLQPIPEKNVTIL